MKFLEIRLKINFVAQDFATVLSAIIYAKEIVLSYSMILRIIIALIFLDDIRLFEVYHHNPLACEPLIKLSLVICLRDQMGDRRPKMRDRT